MKAAVRATSVSLAMARSRWPDFVEMTKPRVGAMVLVTTMVGFYLGLTEPVGWPAVWLLAEVLFGTALVAGGANVLNQFLERDHDAKMRRTRGRPLPTGRVLPGEAIWFGCVCATVGVAILAVQLNGLAALVAGLTCGLYLLVYTPLKRRTPASLLVGAVPGALPPVIGWVAAAGRVELGALVIFSILFCWQVPHFLSIAWVYRSDYSAGGYQVLPVVDPSGRRSARGIVLFSVMLLAVSLWPVVVGMVQGIYGGVVAVAGIVFLVFGVRAARSRTDGDARSHVVASLVYLPLLFGLLMICKHVSSGQG